ncbi:TATA-binding protein-associated phosphoprotein [Entamoeba marina]
MSSNVRYINFRNFQAYEQATFIFLLNEYVDIEFGSMGRFCKSTKPLLNIDTISFYNDDTFDCKSFINNRCNEKINLDIQNGLSKKIAQRKYLNNKFIENIHMLTDILFHFGYEFQTRKSSGKNKSNMAPRVINIFKNNQLLFNEKEIEYNGKMIYSFLLDNVENGGVVLKRGVLSKIFI